MSDCIDLIGPARTIRRRRLQAFLAAGKTVPRGRQVTFTCGNRACVNPEHLKALTVAAKMRLHYPAVPESRRIRITATKRARAPKLDMTKARAIRAALCEGQHQQAVATAFGISKRMVQLIQAGQAWRDPALGGLL